MKKKINWRLRLANPTFIVQCIIAAISPVLVYLGMNFQDLTTWDTLWKVIQQAFGNPALLAVAAWSLYTAITDPTTKGSADDQEVIDEQPEHKTIVLDVVDKLTKHQPVETKQVENIQEAQDIVPELVEEPAKEENLGAKNTNE